MVEFLGICRFDFLYSDGDEAAWAKNHPSALPVPKDSQLDKRITHYDYSNFVGLYYAAEYLRSKTGLADLFDKVPIALAFI